MVCWTCAPEYLVAVGAAGVAIAGTETVVITIAAGTAAVGELIKFIQCVQEHCPDLDIQWAIDARDAIQRLIS
jgi:hypothetical protein